MLAVVAVGTVLALVVGVSLVLLRTLSREPAGATDRAPGTASGRPAAAAGGTPSASVRADPLPAVLTAPPAPGEPPISPHTVKPVLDALWQLRERAMADRDVAALAGFEDGSALFGDSARAGCGCPLRNATTYQELELYVPRQTRYPVRFLAWTVTPIRDGTPLGELTVVTRARPTAPWRISFHTQFVADHVDPLWAGGDQDGFVAAPSEQAHQVAARAPAALTDLWGEAKRTGRVGDLGVLRPGEWTSEQAATYAAHPDGAVQDNGLLARNRFWADPADPLYEFTTGHGSELACRALHRRVVYRGTPGRSPVQDLGRRNWGQEVPPGRYRTVTLDERAQTCFLVAPEDLKVEVLGGDPRSESVATGIR